ncbi:hypothetical protein JRC19_30080, partial [Escherichia coli]|nr:hypothetical protein [Escherichia coli]
IWDEPQPDRDRKRQIRTRWSLTDDVIPRRHDNDEDTDTGETTSTESRMSWEAESARGSPLSGT